MNKFRVLSFLIFFGAVLVCQGSSKILNDAFISSNADDTGTTSYKFTKIGKKYYWIDANITMNRLDAHHACRRLNAQLVTIQSEQEMSDLDSFLKVQNLKTKRIWTAGNDLTMENEFQFISNGQSMSYVKWGPGQPDNARNTEHCVELRVYSQQFLMNDVDCAIEFNFICEVELFCLTKKSISI